MHSVVRREIYKTETKQTKFQRKETYSLNLSVVLQKHTELTFTLAVGLDQYTSRNSVKQLLDELIPYLLSAQIRDILSVQRI